MIKILALFGIFLITYFFLNCAPIQRKYKKLMNIFVYNSFGILIISQINIFRLYNVSFKTYSIIIFGIIFIIFGYVFGFFLYNTVSNKSFKEKTKDSELLKYFDYLPKTFIIIEFFVFIILILYFIKYNKLVIQYGSQYARTIKFEMGYLFNNTLEVLIYNWIITPLISINSIIIAYKVIFKQFKDKTFYFLLVTIFLFFNIGLGRFIIFELFIYFIVMLVIFYPSKSIFYYIKNNRLINNFKMYILIILVSISVINVGFYLTFKRLGFSNLNQLSFQKTFEAFTKQLVVYFEGALRAFDYGIENFFFDINTLGRLTLGGIDEILGYLVSFMGIKYPIINNEFGLLTRETIMIGPNDTYNAFYTGFMNFYIDFNILGVCVISILFGIFISIVTQNYFQKRNSTSLFLLAYVMYTLVLIILKWQYQYPQPWIIFIIIGLMKINLKRGE